MENKNEKLQELDPKDMEQASGGTNSYTPIFKRCDNCKAKTMWIYDDGMWVCEKCRCGPGVQSVL